MIRHLFKFFAISFALLCVQLGETYASDVEIKETSEVRKHIEYYDLDKVHTQILFFVDHLGFSVSSGRFYGFDGHFILNREQLDESSAEVVIKADSLDMGDEAWNDHLKNTDFFNVEDFPNIRFVSESVSLIDDQNAEVSGILTLLGVEKPITFKVRHNKSGTHPFNGQYVAGFTAETMIKRSDFGMTFGLPLLSDDVRIEIAVEGIKQEHSAD